MADETMVSATSDIVEMSAGERPLTPEEIAALDAPPEGMAMEVIPAGAGQAAPDGAILVAAAATGDTGIAAVAGAAETTAVVAAVGGTAVVAAASVPASSGLQLSEQVGQTVAIYQRGPELAANPALLKLFVTDQRLTALWDEIEALETEAATFRPGSQQFVTEMIERLTAA